MNHTSTWREMINYVRKVNGDTSELKINPRNLDLDREFYDGFGTTNGEPFIAWSQTHVYFPIQCEGAEWVESVPRNPCDITPEHKGQ
jgi:hypothetical protein